jgi:salicylate hydroxylase
VVHSADSGAELARLPLGDAMQQRYGAPYFCVHRADLHGVLLDAVREHAATARWSPPPASQIETSDDLVCLSSTDARAWEGDALSGPTACGAWCAQQLDDRLRPANRRA